MLTKVGTGWIRCRSTILEAVDAITNAGERVLFSQARLTCSSSGLPVMLLLGGGGGGGSAAVATTTHPTALPVARNSALRETVTEETNSCVLSR